LQPAGVFVLENVTIQKEEKSEMPFAFSLIFKDEPDYKHLFSARSADLVSSWINAVQECSYEHLRNKLDTYQNMIKSVHGVVKDAQHLKNLEIIQLIYCFCQENLQLSPYVNKRLLSNSQSVKVQPSVRDEAGKPQSKLRPKTESFKCHVPLFDPKTAQLPSQTNNIFSPPANATPVRPARVSDSSRTSSPSASPARVPIRKPPPPPSKDLIEF
jgi:PH domain